MTSSSDWEGLSSEEACPTSGFCSHGSTILVEKCLLSKSNFLNVLSSEQNVTFP